MSIGGAFWFHAGHGDAVHNRCFSRTILQSQWTEEHGQRIDSERRLLVFKATDVLKPRWDGFGPWNLQTGCPRGVRWWRRVLINRIVQNTTTRTHCSRVGTFRVTDVICNIPIVAICVATEALVSFLHAIITVIRAYLSAEGRRHFPGRCPARCSSGESRVLCTVVDA